MTVRPPACILRNRIILFAIAVSLGCHLFWLSSVRIVAPAVKRPVSFSRVTFLGQVPGRGMTEVQLASREDILLTARHRGRLERVTVSRAPGAGLSAAPFSGRSSDFERRLTILVDDAVRGRKLEPRPEPH